MTDVSSAGVHAESQLGQASLPTAHSPALTNGTTAPPASIPTSEDDSIKCICGYADDDGNTVFCELCKTWQHIQCYYPDADVPEVHECVDCRPRALDTKGASERQRFRREDSSLLGDRVERRVKRPAGKSHKKKTRDSVQVNGWTLPERADNAERQGGSPRDQPPPSKRPKTSHKSSASIPSINQLTGSANSRRKNGSAQPGQSPAKSPPAVFEPYPDLYAPEFLQLSQKLPYQVAETNTFVSLGLANDLSNWVRDSEACEKATGADNKEVFIRMNLLPEEFEAMFPTVVKHSKEDESVVVSGAHPTQEYLTINQAVPKGNPIGELKGQICMFEDYVADPANRWATLRHPEPYVFFIPKLPVVLDAREEGNLLRHIRRSCSPNTHIQPFYVEKDESCRFVLIANNEIDEGDEITIGFTLDPSLNDLIRTAFAQQKTEAFTFSASEERVICQWVSVLLANFGGCTCPLTQFCTMRHFDRRGIRSPPELHDGTALKPPKGRSGKKGNNLVSPLSTGPATNSRANSEAAYNHAEQYEDHIESRSVSASSRSKETSRDNTPGASADVLGLGMELSERERRKLQQLERRFENLDTEDAFSAAGRSKQKKRGSAGTALNNAPPISKGMGTTDSTNVSPSATTSSRAYRSAGTDVPGGSGFALTTNNTSTRSTLLQRNEGRQCITRDENGVVVSKRLLGVDPHVVDKATQTDDDRWYINCDQRLHRAVPRAFSLAEEELNRGWNPGKTWKKPNPPPVRVRKWPEGWPEDGKLKPGQVVVVKGQRFKRGRAPYYNYDKGWVYPEDERDSDRRSEAPAITLATMAPPPKPSLQPSNKEPSPAPAGENLESPTVKADISMQDVTEVQTQANGSADAKLEPEDAMQVDPTAPTLEDAALNLAPIKEETVAEDTSPSTAAPATISESLPSPSSDVSKERPPGEGVESSNGYMTNGGQAKESTAPGAESSPSTGTGSWRPSNLHVTLPPRPVFSNTTAAASTSPTTLVSGNAQPATPSSASAMTPGSLSGGAIAQSPLSILSHGGLMSPAIQNSVGMGQSPAKKKLSLKDYTKRMQAQAAATPSLSAPGKEDEDPMDAKRSEVESEKVE